MSNLGDIGRDTLRGIAGMREVVARERRRLLHDMGEIRGLLPLLMKPRNHQRWTRAEKVLLRRHMRRVSRLSPYLVLLAMPGGLLALPAVAWWLDRRRAGTRQ